MVQKRTELINSSAVFSTHEGIFISDLWKPSMTPHTLQKAYVKFYDAEVKDHGHKVLKYFKLVKETP